MFPAADARKIQPLLCVGAELEDGMAREHDLVERTVGTRPDQLLHEDQISCRPVVGSPFPRDRPTRPEGPRIVECPEPGADRRLLVRVAGSSLAFREGQAKGSVGDELAKL